MSRKKERRGGLNAAPPVVRAAEPAGAGGLPERPRLRLTMERKPIAEVLSHGAETPEVEVCGVLLGRIGEDAEGPFVLVSAAIRGDKAVEQGAHVTFTHETWNHIYLEMDRLHPDLAIVGWYHTHPGFGLFLSEMDTFIHQNFFGHPNQLALVYDPLAGKTAVFASTGGALAALPAYFREGREVALDVPNEPGAQPAATDATLAEIRRLGDAVARLETTLAFSRRGWIDEWLIPGLLILILALLLFETYFQRPLILPVRVVTPEQLLAPERPFAGDRR